MVKQTLLIASVGDAPYNADMDAYVHGLVTEDTSTVTVTDMIVTRDKESAVIYYVIEDSRLVEEEQDQVGSGDEAPESY